MLVQFYGCTPDDDYVRRMCTTEARIRELEEAGRGRLVDPRPAIELLQSVPELYERASPVGKAHILEVLLEKCDIDTENVYPVYKKPFGALADYVACSTTAGGLNVERVRASLRGDRYPAPRDLERFKPRWEFAIGDFCASLGQSQKRLF